jgi:acetyl/propionyl-CoA carboxylase alpha subunit
LPTKVAGLANNIDFLVKVVRHPGFTTDIANTGFFTKYMTEILGSLSRPSVSGYGVHTAFGLASYLEAQNQPVGCGLWSGAESAEMVDWRNQRARTRTVNVSHPAAGSSSAVSISTQSDGLVLSAATTDGEAGKSTNQHKCLVRSKSLAAQSTDEHASFSVWDNTVEINGRMVSGTTSIYTNKVTGTKVVDVWLTGAVGDEASHFQFTVPAANFSVDGAASSNTIAVSPMPGKIIQVVAKEGAEVKKGDPIAILEAMKMEHVVYAPCSGTVKVYCTEGSTVSDGTKLAEVVPTAAQK